VDTMRASADFEVIGVVEPEQRRGVALAESKTNEGVAVTTEEQLLNAPGLQAVAVETEVKALVLTAARCIAAGKHIHPDKPAGGSLPALRRLLSAAHGEYKAGRQTLTCPKGRGRYDGDFEDLAKVIRGEKALEFSPAHNLAVHETFLRASGLPVESMCDVGRVLGIQMPNC